MKDRDFPGARWWKFDFHTHTPASDDFAKKDLKPEKWLKAFMDKEIDCVAITDHNSGRWIDKLKSTLEKLQHEKPCWYRDLYLFPGVEISAHGNVHILAIFDSEKSKDDINSFVDMAGYLGKKGDSNAVTNITVTKIADLISERGGIAIPAHADKDNGLLREAEGLTLEQALINKNIYAMELRCATFQKPGLYNTLRVPWTEVVGSDMHFRPNDTLGRFTWVKMEGPSIDDLKLALIDGDGSVDRNMEDDPNQLPDYFINELIIDEAQYIGRSEPLKCKFSPFLSTIIGGFGSGKSTLLEFMRLALRRDQDVPLTLKKEMHRFFETGEDGALINDSRVSLIYRKRGTHYRLNRTPLADESASLEVWEDGKWSICQGEIKSLFPVRIYSQKQIYEIARKPSALLDIVDEASEVDAKTINLQRENLVTRYKQIELKQVELQQNISQEVKLSGEVSDLTRQITAIEKSGHETILQNYGKRQRQLSEFQSVESKWTEMTEEISHVRDVVGPAQFNEQQFSEHADISSNLRIKNEKWNLIRGKLVKLVSEARSIIDMWDAEKKTAIWMQKFKDDVELYESLSTELAQSGIDPSRYSWLLTQQKTLQQELGRISEYRSLYDKFEVEKEEVYQQIKQNRRALSEKRQSFLTRVLKDNEDVSIQVKVFGEPWEDIEEEIRRMLQCPAHFERDFEALKNNYLGEVDNRIRELIDSILAIRDGERAAVHATFAKHLKTLPQESINDLTLWFPKDELRITFGRYSQQIEQGSPGQKNAALLAFILSYGDEPLLLDQPEDDLDNELIYDLIVTQLRETKSKRQIIVITHNANIVVNGDAEMVLPLHVVRRETRVRKDAGSVRIKEVRDTICDILEGGQRAFEQRYRRINLGN